MANNKDADRANDGSNCAACDKPDWADDMVQCDECSAWNHFQCAGVTASVEHRPWSCRNCLPVSVHSRSSRESVRKALEQKRLEEEQQVRRKRFHLEKALEQKRIDQEKKQILDEEKMEKTFLQEKYDLLEQQEADEIVSVVSDLCRSNHEKVIAWIRNDGHERPNTSTSNVVHQKAPNLETMVQNNTSHWDRNLISTRSANGAHIAHRITTDRNTLSRSIPVVPLSSPQNRIDRSTHRMPSPPPACTRPAAASIEIAPLPFQYAASQEVELPYRPTSRGANIKKTLPVEQCTCPLGTENRKLPVWSMLPPPYTRHIECAQSDTNLANDMTALNLGPTSAQIAARRVMSRDLPDFDGSPEEWPIFISQYTITTENCGFTNAENLIRLQRSLKGHARESVRSRLLLPSSVPQAIETLRTLYGRPGLLISALLNRVRTTPPPKMERLETLIDFGMEIQGLCDHLQASGEIAHLNNPSLLQELEDKLPTSLKLQWGMQKKSSSIITLQTFADYMSQMVTAASQVTNLVSHPTDRRISGRKNNNTKSRDNVPLYTHSLCDAQEPGASAANTTVSPKGCFLCDQSDHRIKDCKIFHALTIEKRWDKIHNLKLCRTCLNPHGRNRCRLVVKCGVDGCSFKHHPLLHSKAESTTKVATAESHSHRGSESKVLFRIVPVTLQSKMGTVSTFAFLDEGSSITLVEQSVADELDASGPIEPLCLKWTGDVTRCEAESRKVSFKVSGSTSKKFFNIESARTVSALKLPVQSLNPQDLVQQYPHLKGLPLSRYENAVPRVLIGLDQVNLSLPLKCREGRLGEPVATKTRLGWCIYGGGSKNNVKFTGVCCHISDVRKDKDLHELVKLHFEVDDIGAKSLAELESVDDMRAKKILADTTKRLGDRFETGLLWRYDQFEFPESYHMALRRLECLEKRMSRDPVLKHNVHQQIQAYQAQGYAHRATEKELMAADPRRSWYLPLGIVTHPKKPGKVRLIWDAAAKVDGISLNSLLLKGPDLLTCLPGILIRFREKPVAVSGDIRQMFHQIRIRPEDRHAQRFLWRDDTRNNPEVFLMDVATFGSSCSPCSAQFIKNKNAEDFAAEFPRGAEAVVKCHYVDDYLDCFDTVAEAKQVAAEVKFIHDKGGFDIHGWRSNSPDVLQHLGESTVAEVKNLDLDKGERVLGMLWLPAEDKLGFSTEMRKEISAIINEDRRPTKRQVLRCVMSLFDPLGLLAIYTVHGKILIQSIWRSGTDWDQEIGEEAFDRWRRWTEYLWQVDNVRLSRCYIGQTLSGSLRSIQLHVLVDASEEAYSAAAYYRFTFADGTIHTTLVAAKAKVAPLKPLSIPRLELKAAVLGARLASFIGDNRTYGIDKRIFWSDSSTVLAWIRSDARRYRQYVSCRVGEILTLTESEEWRWVPTKMNTADEATKWRQGFCLSVEGEWFRGPKFLQYPEQQWPIQKCGQKFNTEEEIRSCFVHEVTIREPTVKFERFSRWMRLLRAVAYTLRFISNARETRQQRNFGPLSSSELQKAENELWRICQNESFPDEAAQLKAGNREVDKTSFIFKLSPYIDESGVIRLDGRIGAASNISFNTKFPIILPKGHRLTALILDHYHRGNHHANFETVVNEHL
ncbi:uncharacterized protein LOC128736479 [Sabethes cyaneus]|uniref:uncharacterized protein LOC128736479 n=1 Tax=Sabethes cyaneus TaxID=53552 RepID=UPI00237D5830|nr:uncharacterized protein LOC128736479 [Sabethes cyaneus]